MIKETQNILKGYAILFIVLHNFCHLEQFGLPQENEMSFSLEKWDLFINGSYNSLMIIPSFFSFIGWCGVPVFVFLSGYGLSKKYNDKPIDIGKYIKHSYLKLLVMILPAAILYFSYNLINGNIWWVSRNIFALSFLNNLIAGIGGSFASSIAPPYWYLGMTFQLYLFFVIARKMNDIQLLWGAAFLMVPFFLIPSIDDNTMILGWLRRNSFGWMPLFLYGCYCGRKNVVCNFSVITNVGLLIVSTLFVVWSNSNYYLWCILPIGAIVMFWSLEELTSKNRLTAKSMDFIGRKSMYLFIAHPISISLINTPPYLHDQTVINFYYQLTLYLLSLVVISFVYQYIHNKISSKLL